MALDKPWESKKNSRWSVVEYNSTTYQVKRAGWIHQNPSAGWKRRLHSHFGWGSLDWFSAPMAGTQQASETAPSFFPQNHVVLMAQNSSLTNNSHFWFWKQYRTLQNNAISLRWGTVITSMLEMLSKCLGGNTPFQSKSVTSVTEPER